MCAGACASSFKYLYCTWTVWKIVYSAMFTMRWAFCFGATSDFVAHSTRKKCKFLLLLRRAMQSSFRYERLCINFFFNSPSFLFVSSMFSSFFRHWHSHIYVHATSITFLFTLLFFRQLLLHFNAAVVLFSFLCRLSCICLRSHPTSAALTWSFLLLLFPSSSAIVSHISS